LGKNLQRFSPPDSLLYSLGYSSHSNLLLRINVIPDNQTRPSLPVIASDREQRLLVTARAAVSINGCDAAILSATFQIGNHKYLTPIQTYFQDLRNGVNADVVIAPSTNSVPSSLFIVTIRLIATLLPSSYLDRI
jgi:hypothetical protein